MKGDIKKYRTAAIIFLSVLLTCTFLQFWYAVIFAKQAGIQLSAGSYGINVIPYGLCLAVALFVLFTFFKKKSRLERGRHGILGRRNTRVCGNGIARFYSIFH